MYELILATSISDLNRRLVNQGTCPSSDLKTTFSLYKSILNIFYNNIIIVHEQRMLYTLPRYRRLISASDQPTTLLEYRVKPE